MNYKISKERILELVENIIHIYNPMFSNDFLEVSTYTGMGDDSFEKYEVPSENAIEARKNFFGKYFFWKKELMLNQELFQNLENFLGEELMVFIIDWFNREFDQDCESITF